MSLLVAHSGHTETICYLSAFGAKRTCAVVWLRPPRSRMTPSRHRPCARRVETFALAAISGDGFMTLRPCSLACRPRRNCNSTLAARGGRGPACCARAPNGHTTRSHWASSRSRLDAPQVQLKVPFDVDLDEPRQQSCVGHLLERLAVAGIRRVRQKDDAPEVQRHLLRPAYSVSDMK